MRINTNVSALNAANKLSRVQEQASESMAKLSSGFRINKAADDAAGLGIANKLHADTRAMSQASRNAEQANSLLQVAEGSTSTIQKILERMKELATQSGSDTVDTAGRGRIQNEFKALQDEITRTVETTKFQGTQLLKGTATVAGVTAVSAVTAVTGVTAVTAVTGAGTADVGLVSTTGAATTSFTANKLATGAYTLSDDGTNISIKSGSTVVESVASGAAGATISFATSGVSLTLGSAYDKADSTKRFDNSKGFSITTTSVAAVTGVTAVAGVAAVAAVTAVAGTPQSFLIGSSGQYVDGKDAIKLDAFNLELTTLGISTDDLTTSAKARTALTNIDAAFGKVSDTLGNIGAAQNRIAYAQDNIKTAITNFAAAESVIRDVDMADEMTKFSKSNILSQAGTAMLAQANQAGQGVLQLLRG